MLEELGYEVVRAASGDEALAILEDDQEVDLVFTDVVMPGATSGVDLGRKLRSLRPSLPIVLTTGYSEQLANDKGFPVLAKPYRAETLARTLETELRRSRAS
jgi:CheY-like chemotaxis protein